jgi:hypothetical protein
MPKRAAVVSRRDFTACGKYRNKALLYQGTSLLVPHTAWNDAGFSPCAALKGHGFSRAAHIGEKRASAPEGWFSKFLLRPPAHFHREHLRQRRSFALQTSTWHGREVQGCSGEAKVPHSGTTVKAPAFRPGKQAS